MGYLGNLDKIKTLELFLTDKGKELMLKENGLGLHDLIAQFSLDDEDYDYRRSSEVWVNGISPLPDGSLLPFGTTQSTNNQNSGGLNSWFDTLPPNNPCRTCGGTSGCAPLSGDCWYDMPDVRGDRGKKIINCYSDTGQTQGIQACTNIYAFYDVTSVLRTDADAAKLGLEDWFVGVTATTPNYTGKLFHIAVFGERWVNTSWYPWNGKLDSWDWNGCGNSDIFAGCANSAQFLGGVSGPTIVDTTTGEEIPLYPAPITGLYLQNDTKGIGTGDWAGFNVLPPNSISTDTGGRVEFWTTGCTLVEKGTRGYGYGGVVLTPISNVGFTAYSSTNIVWDPTAFSGTSWSAYTPNDLWLNNGSSLPPPGSSYTVSGELTLNLCEDNCCPSNYPDLGYAGPGLFGCQDCSPFDNTITNGTMLNWQNQDTTYDIMTPDLSAGTMDILRIESIVDCVKYRGMDRNVLIVDVFDEAAPDRWPGGVGGLTPLGSQQYYDGGGNPAVLTTTIIGDPGGELSSGWAANDWTGYHGGYGSAGAYPNSIPIISPSPNDYSRNWNIADAGQQVARVGQPTEDWKYSQDLFLKTHALYESFQGFVYPVVPLLAASATTNAKMVFPLHLYGAIYGEVVPLSEFQDNPTVVAEGGTLAECTLTNPYDTLIPITYNPNGITQMSQNTNSDWEPFDSSQFGVSDMILPIGPSYTKGLRNWGWNFNPTVGCAALPCSVGDIFSGGTFETDLNSFMTGSTSFMTVITSACTECQCLPAVFINKQGPILIIEDEDEGCLCDDGTYSPDCCDGDPPGPDSPIYGICGPLPSQDHIVHVTEIIDQDGMVRNRGKILDFRTPGIEEPMGSAALKKRSANFDRNIKTTEPPLNTKSISGNYSSKYSIDFDIQLNQFLEDDGKINWDVKFTSTSQYGNIILEEGDDIEFYWVLSPGYIKGERNPKITQGCKTPSYSLIKQNRKTYKGINIAFLKGYWGENQPNADTYKSTYRGETSYEFCVTMAYKYLGKVLKKTKRFNISGTDAGYRINIKT